MEKNEFNQDVGYLIENCQPRIRPERIRLVGNYCTLEPFNIDKHADKLFANLSLDNPGDSWTYLPYGPFTTVHEFRQWAENLIRKELDTELYVVLKENIPVGILGYLRINPEHAVIEIGHVHFSKLLQKTPAATEAVYLLIRYAFDDLKYRRCEWKCHSLNEPSRKAALRFGFTFEGIFRQSNILKNRNRDTAWFSIIDSEWPRIKEKFQRWLHPQNFSMDGRQIEKLSEA